MKYILVKVTFANAAPREFPFIFSDHMVHAEMEKAAAYAISKSIAMPTGIQVISAGEFSSTCIEGCCGESTSLGVRSRNEGDDLAISMHDYTHGII